MTNSNEDSLICSKCGKSNDESGLFCSYCGNPLKKAEIVEEKATTEEETYTSNQEYIKENAYNKNNSSSKNFTSEELTLFLEKNQPYYMEKFKVMENTGDKKSWNWCPFLIGAYWMFYRKMYVEGVIYIVANAILAIIPFIGWILNIALWIGAGILGNSFYYEHVKKKFIEISCTDNSMREMLIQQKGGTNLILPIVLLIIPVIVAIIGSIIFSAIIGSMSYYY